MKTNKHIQFWSILLVFLTMLGIGQMWGDEYSFTFSNGDLTTSSTSFTKSEVTWSLSDTENSWNGTSGKYGYVFGSASTPKPLTVSTSEISGAITQVTVTGRSHKSGQTATVSVTVGSTAFTTSDDTWDNGNNQTLTFTGSASGTISVHIEPDACGHVLYGISVTYTTADPYTVYFNAEGGTCGTASLTEASTGAGVTMPAASPTGVCASEGWEFAGWATATCSESSAAPRLYVEGSTYYPSADDETLHAVYRKEDDGSTTSTATFTASTLSGLTTLASNATTSWWWLHTASGVEFYIEYYAIYSSAFNIDNSGDHDGDGWALLEAHRRIKQVVLTLSNASNSVATVTPDAGTAALSTSSTTQTITCTGDVTQLELVPNTTNDEAYITTFTVTYYNTTFNSNPSCCDKAVEVSYNSAGSTNISTMAFSAASTATCGGESTREVTVTVTPSSGYFMKSGDRLTWSKTSGTIPSDPTWVSGPTDNGNGTWSFVYRFAQNDNGVGKFAASGTTLTNYRTACCTDPGLAYGTGSVSKTFGDGTFKNTLTNSNSVTVTYASSVPEVATVAADGTVTIVGAGTTTITASCAQQTISTTTYCADEASYTLTVNKANISPTLTYSPASVAVDENSVTPTVGGNPGSGGVTYAITSATPAGCATINPSTGVVTGVEVGSITVTATVAATDNYNGNTATATVTIIAATNFPNNKTIFIWAHSSSAWDASACVVAWFHSYGGSETAQSTYWLFDATGGDAGKKLFAAVVPSSGNLPYLDINRYASDCTTPWNKNGGVSYSEASGSNAVRSEGSSTNEVYWNATGVTIDLHGDPSGDEWASSLASFSDQGAGEWTATYSNYAPANAAGESQNFKAKTNYNGWIGNTGSNNNATLDGMHVGSTYNITATLNVTDHSLVMSKTFVKGTVHFDLQGHGSSIADVTNVTAGSKISAPSAPSATGYTFGGWYKEPACTNAWNFASDVVNETMTLYAKWTLNAHDLTWNLNGGATTSTTHTGYASSTVAYGTSITYPANNTMSKTGYTFASWSPAAPQTMPDNDLSIAASWTANTYQVRFNANGGSGSMSNQNFTYDVAQNLSTCTFTHATKSFEGWTTNSDGTGDEYANGANVSNLSATQGAVVDLYAKWVDCDLYTVTLKVHNDTYQVLQQGSCGAAVDLSGITPLSTCLGSYTFVGWRTTDPGTTTAPSITTSYTPTSNTTLYAVYSKTTYVDWERIESDEDLSSWDTYIITSYDNARAMNALQESNNRHHTDITKSADKKTIASVPNTVGQFMLLEDGSNWNIYDILAAGNSETEVYLYAASSSSNYMRLTDDDADSNAEWSISISSGAATVKAQGDATHNWMLENGGIFSCYASKSSSYKLLSFYKYVHEASTTYTTQPEISVRVVTKGAEDPAAGTYTIVPGVVCEGGSVTLTATPTGSSFINWSSNNGGTFANASSATTTFTPANATTTVTANFGMLITLDKNNASASTDGSASVTANATELGTMVAPTYTGHHVEGYYDDAVWTHKVADNEGNLQANVAGYTGAGGAWTRGSGATLYTKWETNTHDLTWNLDGGATSSTTHTGYASSTVAYGTSITYPANNTMNKTGYTFNGWSPAAPQTMPDEDMTITALWTQNNWTLTMATDPVGVSSAITSPRSGAGTVENKHYGDAITVTVSTPSHYTFDGWTSSNGGSFTNDKATTTTFTMPDNATTVTAHFTAETPHTVTWSDNGGTSTTDVFDGETTTFPALEGCDMYAAAGWVLDDGTFTSETMTKPGTIYAAGATTPAITADVTYKAVYRHKYYTSDEFVLNTTTSGGYYLSANPGTRRYSAAKNGSKIGTVTSTASAVPVYLEKEETGKYSFKLVGVTGEQYIVGASGGDFGWQDTKTGDYKWSVAAGDQGKGDWHILNAGTNNTRGIIYNNSSGNYIGNYLGTNVTSGGTTYYDIDLIPGYYYKYSPTKACYTIDYSPKNSEILACSLSGNVLTVKVQCGKRISSWSFSPENSATLASGDEPEYVGMEGDKTVYRFTIIPNANTTLNLNSGNGPTRTISFLDGATNIGQTKTTAITDKRDCGSYDLPAGYSTASGSGGTCTGWTFDGWTATNYTYGQMGTPSDIVAAGTSQDVHGDKTWYAVYHKTFAAGAYFKIKYGDYYIADYGSNQFNTTTTEADGLMFQLEDGYLYYIDKTTRANKWVYFVGPSGQNVTVSDAKPTSNLYKTTFTEDGGVYDIVCNSKHLKLSGDNVKYLTTASGATKPNASAFTAYYPKTDCTIEYVTITYDAGAGNSCSPASASVESGATISLPVEADLTYDNTDWRFIGWSESSISGMTAGAPADLIAGGGSYSTFTNVTLHAVYSQVPPDGTFDNSKGGRYIIWGEDDEDTKYYAKSNNQTKGKLSNTLSCSQAAIFEFVETETDGQYKIHIVGEAKYLAGETSGSTPTDFEFVNAEDAPVWTVVETAPSSGLWKVISTSGNRAFIFETTGSKQFGHYSTNNPVSSPGLYKFVHIGQCDDYYTTNPNKALNITGNVLVTSTNGRMIMAKDQLTVNASNIGAGTTITLTSNSSDVYFSLDRNANISKAAANQPKTSVTFNANGSGDVTQTVYVHYMPSVGTNGIETVTITAMCSEKTAENTIKVRHLPATFAIAAKVGTAWYALTGNMKGAATPKAIQIDVDESTWTAYAPDTCAYQIWPVKTTNTAQDRYALQGGNAYGERVRFSAVNNAKQRANAGLWANNSGSANTIDNDAAITAISSDPAAAYEWKITATEVSGTWKYTLQTDQSNNTNKLNIYRAADLVWGTYTDGQAQTSEIYLLPISEITPFEFQVVEWYPTKMLIYTDNDMSETTPTIKIDGETVASTTFTGKGGKLYEVGNLTTLTSHPSELLKVTYTKSAVTYTAVKTIPVILSRCTLNVTAAPFSTLTKEVYSKTDLVVRDNSILTLNGTQAENEFYDVTIYPTAKISVPSDKTFSVHSLTFFGGIDEIYNGSSYDLNKYGVPQLSMKGIFKKKTVSTIDYVMRVDDSQMYSLALPYDVNLTDIKYWNGTAMTLGTHLWVSAYDGEARATGVGRTWIYEEQFESKFGAAKLTAGVGYTISAEYLAALGSTYSIIRMPMTSNIAVDASEAAKSVAVKGWTAAGAHDNNKGWNLVGNPYMVSVSGSTAGGATNTKLAVGHLVETGTGPWEWVSEEYRYVTIPHDNGSDYYQQKWTDATLPPFKNFFLQVIEDGDLTFALASRQNAPARYLEAAEREVEFEVLLSNDSRQDNMGLLIAEKYSPAYEINADLEKMIGTMSVYSIYGGYKLAYNALSPEDAEQFIPIGYVAPTAGEYTFALDEESDVTEIDHIYLTDYQENVTIDLMEQDYTFVTANGKNENRFAINATLKDESPGTTTDVGNLSGDSDKPTKFIYRDKMYIMRGGKIYDSTGKMVKEINK